MKGRGQPARTEILCIKCRKVMWGSVSHLWPGAHGSLPSRSLLSIHELGIADRWPSLGGGHYKNRISWDSGSGYFLCLVISHRSCLSNQYSYTFLSVFIHCYRETKQPQLSCNTVSPENAKERNRCHQIGLREWLSWGGALAWL